MDRRKTTKYWKGRKFSASHIEKLCQAKRKNPVRSWLGKKFTKKHKEKISQGVKRAIIEGRKIMPVMYGLENPNWKGGISEYNHKRRTSATWRKWRKLVFQKDHYTCQKCGDNHGHNLHPHHIKFWYKYPKLRFDVRNGTTLCELCHRNLHKGKLYGELRTDK